MLLSCFGNWSGKRFSRTILPLRIALMNRRSEIQDQIAPHTAFDIVLSAVGRNAAIFTGMIGMMDNTDVFFEMMRLALGDKSVGREIRELVGSDSGRGDDNDDYGHDD